MPNRTFRIGTRTSPLALRQVEEVLTSLRESLRVPDGCCSGGLNLRYSSIKFEIIGIDTWGDKDKKTPISDMEGSDFFTREIEEALLRGEIDLAVHSAKDLPDVIPEGLCIAAITESIDPYDALVSRDNLKLEALPAGARIGASSQRRKAQLKKYRNDFQIVDIRGTIEERLQLLDYPEHRTPTCPERSRGKTENRTLDAIVVAACALVRLGLQHRIAQRIPFEILTPHPLQGALAIEVRKNEEK